jgi:hypothetical protein
VLVRGFDLHDLVLCLIIDAFLVQAHVGNQLDDGQENVGSAVIFRCYIGLVIQIQHLNQEIRRCPKIGNKIEALGCIYLS